MNSKIIDSSTVSDVIYFAHEAHVNHFFRNTQIPYMAHIDEVCFILHSAYQKSPSFHLSLALCCGYLHDTVEDTSVSLEQIESLFGNEIAQGVDALTKREALEDPMGDSLRRIKLQPEEIWIVKIADRISNLRTPPEHWNVHRIQSYHQEAKRIAEALEGCHPHLELHLQEAMDSYYEKYIAQK